MMHQLVTQSLEDAGSSPVSVVLFRAGVDVRIPSSVI